MNNNTSHKLNTLKLPYFPQLAQQLFAPISDQPWAMLLKSASATHPDSRFDILVANPLVTLETKGEQTKISEGSQINWSEDDPFSLLDQHLNEKLPETQQAEDVPFTGGALGYFSYDLGRRVEKLPEIAKADIAIPEMAVGIYDWALIVDHKLQSAFFVGHNLTDNRQWLESQANQTTEPFALTSDWSSNMSESEYCDKFYAIQEYLRSGDCYQINLSQRFSASYTGSEWEAYSKLEQDNQAPFSAFIKIPEASILSVSPERFISVYGQNVETKPIKGTRPRSSDPVTDKANAEELKNAPKDQAENLMIVDLLRNDIGRVAKPGSVSVPKLFEIESFPSVHHLVSTVTASLDAGYSSTDLLRAAFPGGSITGAPKVRAMEIIEELEPQRRSVYCGSIGYISRCGKMDTSITIRTLIASENTLYASAGGAIVADSKCDEEYQETYHKLSKILPVLR